MPAKTTSCTSLKKTSSFSVEVLWPARQRLSYRKPESEKPFYDSAISSIQNTPLAAVVTNDDPVTMDSSPHQTEPTRERI